MLILASINVSSRPAYGAQRSNKMDCSEYDKDNCGAR
jgi:hypothetical protein